MKSKAELNREKKELEERLRKLQTELHTVEVQSRLSEGSPLLEMGFQYDDDMCFRKEENGIHFEVSCPEKEWLLYVYDEEEREFSDESFDTMHFLVQYLKVFKLPTKKTYSLTLTCETYSVGDAEEIFHDVMFHAKRNYEIEMSGPVESSNCGDRNEAS
jgi:hypothetical protein